MARFKGEGSLKNKELIAYINPKKVFDNGKGVKRNYIDVQLNSNAVPQNEIQTDLHLHTEVTEKNGKKLYNHSASYSDSQVEAMRQAAGDNVIKLESGTEIIGFKGDVMTTKNGDFQSMIVNTKEGLQPSDLKLTPEISEQQKNKMKESRAELTKQLDDKKKENEKESKKPVQTKVAESAGKAVAEAVVSEPEF